VYIIVIHSFVSKLCSVCGDILVSCF